MITDNMRPAVTSGPNSQRRLLDQACCKRNPSWPVGKAPCFAGKRSDQFQRDVESGYRAAAPSALGRALLSSAREIPIAVEQPATRKAVHAGDRHNTNSQIL